MGSAAFVTESERKPCVMNEDRPRALESESERRSTRQLRNAVIVFAVVEAVMIAAVLIYKALN